MKDVNWEWEGSTDLDCCGGSAFFSVGNETYEIEFSSFKEADTVFKLLRTAYILGKEAGISEVCRLVRKAYDQTCLD